MNTTNLGHEYVLRCSLMEGVSRYVVEIYREQYAGQHLSKIVSNLRDAKAANGSLHDLGDTVTEEILYESLDLRSWLSLIRNEWNSLFKQRLKDEKILYYVQELLLFRDRSSHEKIDAQAYNNWVRRAADTSALLLEALGDTERSQVASRIVHDLTEIPNPLITEPAITEEDTQTVEALGDKLYLEVIQQDGLTRHIALEENRFNENRLIIGRKPNGDRGYITVDDPRVSRVHLLVTRQPAECMVVTDLMSANGTTLEETRLVHNKPVVWPLGRRITIGSTWLILRRGS